MIGGVLSNCLQRNKQMVLFMRLVSLLCCNPEFNLQLHTGMRDWTLGHDSGLLDSERSENPRIVGFGIKGRIEDSSSVWLVSLLTWLRWRPNWFGRHKTKWWCPGESQLSQHGLSEILYKHKSSKLSKQSSSYKSMTKMKADFLLFLCQDDCSYHYSVIRPLISNKVVIPICFPAASLISCTLFPWSYNLHLSSAIL